MNPPPKHRVSGGLHLISHLRCQLPLEGEAMRTHPPLRLVGSRREAGRLPYGRSRLSRHSSLAGSFFLIFVLAL